MKIQVFPLDHQGIRRIGINPLGFDKTFPAMMKQIPGSRWTPDEKCWHIPYQSHAYAELKRIFGEGQIHTLTQSPQKPRSSPSLKSNTQTPSMSLKFDAEVSRMQQKMILQRYSPSTVKTYRSFFCLLLAFFPDRHPESLEKTDLMKFLLHGVKQRKWSNSAQNQAVNAVKYYFEKVLAQDYPDADLQRWTSNR